ncbi:MAG TPA: beta-galactosidase [Bryobacteraceae bacterium]|nr:beta-galactosidase [Bryobacteraceae bacterium]
MRPAAFFLCLASWLAAAQTSQSPAPNPQFVHAVEFPYYLYPRTHWERELVWLKSIGIRTVEFSIPWNWHELKPGDFDFTGRTSPRRDLVSLLRTLRKLDLRAWVRPLPPVNDWENNGWPGGAERPDAAAQSAWLEQLDNLLGAQTSAHGGPIAFVEGRELAIGAPSPPGPITIISATGSTALARSRAAMASGAGTLLWTNVEDALYPAGYEPLRNGTPVSLLRPGAVDLSGGERPATAALRRDAALLAKWEPLVATLKRIPLPPPASGEFPRGVTAIELASNPVSALSVTNRGQALFRDVLHVPEPATKHIMDVPISVPAGQSLWLPLNLTLSGNGLCHECSEFSEAEHVVYATAELLNVEFENGILAMEFASPGPDPAEVVLQLAHQPVGPYIAGGKPTDFDWDDKTLRARLTIPVGKGLDNHVRVGLAIEEPETSAFFGEAKRLVIGRKNPISTVYSSEDVANRSRLRVPQGFTATPQKKSPNEIDYTVEVPAGALHGDWAPLTLEADGVPLGRARLQLFRPVSVRLAQALDLPFGPRAALDVAPDTVSADARAGGSIEVVLRNNSPEIQNYRIEASGDGLEFSPRRTEIAIAGTQQRSISLRVFPEEGLTGLRDWRLRLSGGAGPVRASDAVDLPFRLVLIPRDTAATWSADLDSDGSPEWVIESAKVRAVFSSADGGRWMALVWKDTDTNFLPPEGAFARPGPVEVHAGNGVLTFTGKGWTRTVSLSGDTLTIDQSVPFPADSLPPARPTAPGNLALSLDRQAPGRAVYRIQPNH